MKLLLDENVHAEVGAILEARGHFVERVQESFLPGTPDDDLMDYAKSHGLLIVSHDQKFMARVNRPRRRSLSPAAVGYGRIHLIGRESAQPARIADCARLIEMYYEFALNHQKRLIIAIADTFVRFDDVAVERRH